MTFAWWVTGLLACWCWCVWGCRSNVDMKSLKDSVTHMINESEGWAFTSYVNGRNKLCGKKKGTRPWNCFFICTCPGGKHNAVSDGWAWTMTPEGNCRTPPTFCTECPINCFKLKLIRAGDNPMHLFSKWTKTPQTWASDHGNPVAIAMLWLTAQGCDGSRPYDTNAG